MNYCRHGLLIDIEFDLQVLDGGKVYEIEGIISFLVANLNLSLNMTGASISTYRYSTSEEMP